VKNEKRKVRSKDLKISFAELSRKRGGTGSSVGSKIQSRSFGTKISFAELPSVGSRIETFKDSWF